MIKCVKWKSEVLLSEKARCIHHRLTTRTGDCICSPQKQNCLAGKWLTLAILDLAAWLKQPDLMQIQLNFNPALCIPPSHVQCIFPSHAQIIPSILHTTEYSRNFATPYLTAMSVSLSAITQDSSLLMFLKTEWWWQCMACCSYGSSGDCVILWRGIFRHILERKKEKVCE